MKPWKTLTRSVILDHSKFLTVENHTVELPDGRIIKDWPWVITPNFANIVAMTEDDQFLCFRQTKYAIEDSTLAVVGGYLEPDEEPMAAAQRELHEETGYEATDWIDLGHYPVDGNRGAGVAHMYLARGAHHVAAPHADDLEEQELLTLSRDGLQVAYASGQFKILSHVACVALALLWLGK